KINSVDKSDLPNLPTCFVWSRLVHLYGSHVGQLAANENPVGKARISIKGSDVSNLQIVLPCPAECVQHLSSKIFQISLSGFPLVDVVQQFVAFAVQNGQTRTKIWRGCVRSLDFKSKPLPGFHLELENIHIASAFN